jgi:gamma-glutamyltranspeptidase/glutathione hydrolase
MGGAFQPQGHVQVLTSLLDFGLTLQEAIDVPRWRHTAGLDVLLEHGTPRATFDALAERGHRVEPASGFAFGGAQAILVDPATGTYVGASDPRKDGCALGY